MRDEDKMNLPTGGYALAGILFLLAGQGRASTIDGGAVDETMRRIMENDCFGGSTGLSWCPEIEECIQPWAETCPIDGDTFEGGTTLICEGGRCSSDEKCSWTDGGAVLGTYYFTDLNGEFHVPDECSANCTGCEPAPEDNTIVGIPNPASVACEEMDGESQTLYEADGGQYGICIFDDGTACEEWALRLGDCAKGSMPVFSTYCDDNDGQLANQSVDWGDVEGAPAAEYQVCAIGDNECLESSYYSGTCMIAAINTMQPIGSTPLESSEDENSCLGGSTGLRWCPEIDECIQPWSETCPIDGDTFVGPTALICDGGRCSSSEKCSWTEGSAEMATFYFTDMNGIFLLPDECTANCTSCDVSPENNTSSDAVSDMSSVNSTVDIQSGEDSPEALDYTSEACNMFVNGGITMTFVVISLNMLGLFSS